MLWDRYLIFRLFKIILLLVREEEILQRISKLVAGSVGIVGTATSDYLPADVCAGAAG